MTDLRQRMEAAANKLGLPDDEDKELDWNHEEGWIQYESGYYFDDDNHSGLIYVSQKMVDKYELDGEEMDDEWLADELKGSYDEEHEAYIKELKAKYAQKIVLSHATCYSAEGCSYEHYLEGETETPHGDIGSKEFVAWWNDFPVELLSEGEDDVYIAGWRDG